MRLHSDIKELLKFLQKNPVIRNKISAKPNKTLLYAGNTFGAPVWMRIKEDHRNYGLSYGKTILPDALENIYLTGKPYKNLLEWANKLDEIKPWDKNGYIIWRALSGIFASNAIGAVSFMIWGGVLKSELKVFATTEVSVLNRNPLIDNVTKDILQYYLRCVENNQSDINFSIIRYG